MAENRIVYPGDSTRHMSPQWEFGAHFLDALDNFDRPGNAHTEGPYACAGTYAHAFTNTPGERVPKAGAYAEAGLGRAFAEWRIFQAEAKGPNISAHAYASVPHGVSVMARAEIVSASASAGPFKVKVELGIETGVAAGPNGIEVKVLGTGAKLGPAVVGVSFLGNEVSCAIM